MNALLNWHAESLMQESKVIPTAIAVEPEDISDDGRSDYDFNELEETCTDEENNGSPYEDDYVLKVKITENWHHLICIDQNPIGDVYAS